MITERMPMKRDEYFALKYLFSINCAVDFVKDHMGARLNKYLKPSARRELTRMINSSWTLVNALIATVPDNQQRVLKREMEQTEFYVRTKSVTPYNNDEYDYVSVKRTDLSKLTAYAMHSECEMCDRQGKAAAKCPLSVLLRSVYMYDTPPVMKDGTCFYNLYQPNFSDDPLERLEQMQEEAGA